MDYKEKYEMALEGIQEILSSGEDSIKMSRLQLRLQGIFPELKEGEGERIRKEILDYIVKGSESCYDVQQYGRGRFKKWIAWLEKQGEHANFRNKIQIGDKVTRNEDGVLVNLSQLNRIAKKQGEQKPADTEKGANGDEREIPIPEPPLTIKHAKEVMGIKQNDAWSEEDEKIYQSIMDDIVQENQLDDKQTDWLKSLKERFTWKPSKEQMNTLEYYMHTLICNERKEILFGLYTDLKKLK